MLSALEEQIARLGKRLERARKARLEAEAIAERSTRELFEKDRQLLLLQEIAVAANEARAVDQALQFALDRVCTYTGWPVGHAYLLDSHAPGRLVPTRLWHLKSPARFAAFRDVTETTPLASGSGLPGRVLATGKPFWLDDVTRDANFPRSKAAADSGVKAGFAFPVLIGAEVVAVLEFFAQIAQEPDERLLHAMAHIGTQIGRVVERRREETTRQFSTPVLPVRERLLILPVIGVIDPQRAQQLNQELLRGIHAHRAKVVVIDITGVPALDAIAANHLVRAVDASRLMGATVIVTGLSSEIARTLVAIGVDLSRMRTVGDLQGGIEEADRLLGYRVATGAPADDQEPVETPGHDGGAP